MPRQKTYTFRSAFELTTALWLGCRDIRYEFEEYAYEYDFPIPHGWCPACSAAHVVRTRTYLCDFTFPRRDWVLEAKGKLDRDERAKFLAIKDAGVEVRFVFQRNNKLYPKSKTRYSNWCERHGFEYAIGAPDVRWFQ